MKQDDSLERPLRRIKSFVKRSGRMTELQRQAYQSNWQRYGLERGTAYIDFEQIFSNQQPVILEIGFGMGKSLAEMVRKNPDKNYIGIEVHRPGVGKLLALVAEQGSDNIRIYEDDAVEVLKSSIHDQSLSGVQVYFPDPWHKKRHNKRRLIQTDFVDLLVEKIKSGGVIHLATDWEPYAEQMLKVLSANPAIRNQIVEDVYAPRPEWRPETKFEQRGARLGHGVWDLLFEKI